MGDNEVEFWKPLKDSGVGESGRRKHDIEFEPKDNCEPPLLHDLRAQRGGRVDEYWDSQRLRSLIDRKEKIRVRGLAGHVGEHAHPFEPQIQNSAIELLQSQFGVDE